MTDAIDQELLNKTVNLDPDHYEYEILKHTTSQGLFKVPLQPPTNPNMAMAFMRLIIGDCIQFVDIIIEPVPTRVPTPDGKGTVEFQPMTLKLFKLTEKGYSRKRRLEIKFPGEKLVIPKTN